MIASFFLMELVAWFSHKYIMHGILWVWHEDHHNPKSQKFQKNDLFFILFAIPGASLVIIGIIEDFNYLFYLGLGVSLYGLAYFFVHDVFIHQRIKFLRSSKFKYLNGLREAHRDHHQQLEKEGAKNFGMLIVSFKYFRKKTNSK